MGDTQARKDERIRAAGDTPDQPILTGAGHLDTHCPGGKSTMPSLASRWARYHLDGNNYTESALYWSSYLLGRETQPGVILTFAMQLLIASGDFSPGLFDKGGNRPHIKCRNNYPADVTKNNG